MESFEFATRENVDYIESLYQQYLKDPRSLDEKWKSFFAGYDLGVELPSATILPGDGDLVDSEKAITKGVYALVHYYREFGHFVANLDPLGHNRKHLPLLELSEVGLSTYDLDKKVGSAGFVGPTDGTLRDLIKKLKMTYCQTIGVEYTWISDKAQRTWLQERMEPILNKPIFSKDEVIRILTILTASDEFELFLQKKYLGKKRFSIEGADSLLPILDTLIESGASLGVDEIVMGMTHRGRLNVLAHVMNKPYELILSEFEESSIFQDSVGDGDVKYHLGYSTDHVSAGGQKVHVSLSSNPSHLELINPVIEGIIRAKQEYRKDQPGKRTVPVLMHGEAAFTGQGIVSETLNLSQLEGYQTGGTVHVIINNQLGYTATHRQTRFSPYPTDVMKMIEAPVFHVNGDDPHAVVHAARLAMGFRQRFNVDVVIDLTCYRRFGHNESDDPTFTQPLMYKEIDSHPRVVDVYAQKLVKEHYIEEKELDNIREEVRNRLGTALDFAKELKPRQHVSTFGARWSGIKRTDDGVPVDTSVGGERLLKIAEKATRIPPGFAAQGKLKKMLSGRMEMAEGKQPVDWGCAEMFAFGSLLLEGYPVRLAGQDSQRGTFSHRHSVWHDTDTGNQYVPLSHLSEDQARFTVLNTMLSELAVLGFEYGISAADPYRLTVWEAQFGDFLNGAQGIVDQFLVSAESKWERRSGIVLLLPHGFEGQGPDHSSARIERFLTLCADDNIQVCYPTTPAQYFHLLRRQILRKIRKPLIVFSPKSLLRNKRSFSPLREITDGKFHPLFMSAHKAETENIRRVIFSTGKIYFDLMEELDDQNIKDIAIVRMEQLYPVPLKEFEIVVKRHKGVKEFVWVQEEPENMGAWCFIERRTRKIFNEFGLHFRYIGREEAASPATGLYHVHLEEQSAIIKRALRFD